MIVKIFACPESSFQGFVSTLVAEECVHRVQQIRNLDPHWHQHAVVLRVRFPCQSALDRLVGVGKRGCSLLL